MRVTIIPSDGFVSIDGVNFHNLDLSNIDPTVHAVQWYETYGEIEVKDPTTGKMVANIEITSIETNGTTAVSISTGQVVTLTNALPIASGGTGTTSTTFVNLATNVTGTLPVGNGGTGLTTATGVLVGSGSTVSAVAAGASGNILTSNGTTWTSAAAAPSGATAGQHLGNTRHHLGNRNSVHR